MNMMTDMVYVYIGSALYTCGEKKHGKAHHLYPTIRR
jgi:hypothetical protein